MEIIKESYRNKYLNFDLYPNFLDPEEAIKVYTYLEKNIRWNLKITSGRRVKCIFGDNNLEYRVQYKNGSTNTTSNPWDPIVKILKERVESLTGQKYNICVIQRYPNGNVGIAPHKDKEMILGTTISGISLGVTRTFKLEYGKESISKNLTSGSLYVMNPPTNSYYTHCINKDDTKDPRISLTFRNYSSL